MQVNQISASLSKEDQDAIMKAIALIKEKMPFLVSLTGEQIQHLIKMGDQGYVFATKSLEIATQNEEIMPRGFDIDEFRRDMELFQALRPINLALSQLLQLIDNTQMLVGSDCMMSGHVVYAQVKDNHFGLALEEASDHLSQRFIRKSKRKPTEPDPPKSK